MTREALLALARAQYGAEAAYLWKKYPKYCVLRRPSGKWFALVMDVPRSRLGLPGEGSVDVVDVKCGPLLLGSYLGRPGFAPAYHMNKEHWVSVLLDGTASQQEIEALLDISFGLTK